MILSYWYKFRGFFCELVLTFSARNPPPPLHKVDIYHQKLLTPPPPVQFPHILLLRHSFTGFYLLVEWLPVAMSKNSLVKFLVENNLLLFPVLSVCLSP